jgi:F-type H+-transporting ATPase subunit delta
MSTSPPAGGSAQFDQDELMLADVYAKALLEAAQEKGAVDEVAAALADLVAYMDRDPDFELFLTADSVDDDPRRASLEKLFRGRMSDLLLNLLQVLNNRGRTGLVRAIARRVQLRMEARRHEQEVTVRTAVPLADELREQIRRTVGEYIGRQPILIEQVDPGLIGGLVLQIGDERVDASVAARLRIMLKRLMERARAEVHAGERYVAET